MKKFLFLFDLVRLMENSLFLRRLMSRCVTRIRKSKKTKEIIKKLGFYGEDIWASNKDEKNFEELYQNYTVDFSKYLTSNGGKIGLIACSDDAVNKSFIDACVELKLDFEIYDPVNEKFFENIKNSKVQNFLVRPSHNTQLIRQMFFEKIEIVASQLKKEVYPSIAEQKIYEAKRTLAYFLLANNIPHPKTSVFYNYQEAKDFIESAHMPIVFKTHNGASATGVEIIKNRKQALRLIKACFEKYYLNKSISDYRDIDYDYVIFQEYIKEAREHRVIKIGNSWMGHEKAYSENNEFMSGSGKNLWTQPSFKLLDFCRDIAEKHNFSTMCFDIFEDSYGNFYVNELQTWFGSYNPSQMYIGNVPGRFLYSDGKYIFQEGLFNHHQSISLRIIDFLNKENL
jgi:hypothetical protein